MTPGYLVQIALFLAVPAGLLWGARRSKFIKTVSPVVLCYAFGIALANQPWWKIHTPLSLRVGEASIALAIPLLLFSADIVAWMRLAGRTVFSFFLCIASVVTVSAITAHFFSDRLADTHKIAAMMVGVYTGGTVNMAAIATALGVPSETFILLNAADLFITSFYLLFLITLAGPLWARILPAFPAGSSGPSRSSDAEPIVPQALAGTLMLACGIVMSAALVSRIVPNVPREVLSLLTISSLSVGASFHKGIRAVRGTADAGHYLLLVFCVAIGSTARLASILASGGTLLLFTACVVVGSVLLHLLLSFLFRIDRDTVIITSAAGLFGPAFIPPIALSLGNKEIVFSGIATGLVGYAVANYVGLALAWVLL